MQLQYNLNYNYTSNYNTIDIVAMTIERVLKVYYNHTTKIIICTQNHKLINQAVNRTINWQKRCSQLYNELHKRYIQPCSALHICCSQPCRQPCYLSFLTFCNIKTTLKSLKYCVAKQAPIASHTTKITVTSIISHFDIVWYYKISIPLKYHLFLTMW